MKSTLDIYLKLYKVRYLLSKHEDPGRPEIMLFESHSEEQKTTEGVVVHAVIIDYPVCLELCIHIVSHLEGDDHSVAAHVVAVRP